MWFMNSSLDRLVKNLSDEGFKYLAEELDSKNLRLLKQKCAYPLSIWTILKDLMKKKLPAKKYFFSSTKKGKTVMIVKYQTVT